MKYEFVRFEGNWTRGDRKIGINKSGLIRFSSSMYRSFNLTRYKFVVLFYDSANNAIAIKPTNVLEKGVLRITKDRTGGTISGKAFMNSNRLNPADYRGRYDWKKLALPHIGEVFVVDLEKR